MAYDYDKLYRETPDALGAPSAAFTAFFDRLDARGLDVLDAGCGQGRDALFIARMGHRVTGVDISPHGIRHLLAAAQRENLAITGIAADLTVWAPDKDYDILMFDRTLHMLAAPQRRALLTRCLPHLRPGGWVLISDEQRNLKEFRQIVAGQNGDWHTDQNSRGLLFVRRG
ncbi:MULTISPECIES: class I SAM-dependent methyltransferase [Leisingera]|jgi:2-polyprenyl-3-methyl-5-hydroxy-6-metoxy-1,4-benzoquinol methylase|uniref:class I SAM-dependent methyltransferase n=1 Tax=Leisingera TaxID=191028 RepID=UPI0011500FF7|nr:MULTISPECIES: class I SAM-dependent methyltransferase [Leisingera]QDI76404.1 class I SAM-dependent methyltransferase [Leisingera aquaemixtae]